MKYFQFISKNFVKFCVELSILVFIWAWFFTSSVSFQRRYSSSLCEFMLCYCWILFTKKKNVVIVCSGFLFHFLLEKEAWKFLEVVLNGLLCKICMRKLKNFFAPNLLQRMTKLYFLFLIFLYFFSFLSVLRFTEEAENGIPIVIIGMTWKLLWI